MKQMRYLIYCLSETRDNVFDYRGLSIVALVTSALSMLCVGLFFLIYVNLHEIVQAFEEEIRINLYLDEHLTADQRLALEQVILSYPEVNNTEFVSHLDAIEAYLEQYPTEKLLMTSLDEKTLPASFVIGLAPAYQTISSVTALAKKLENVDGITDIQYGEKWIQTLWWGNYLMILIGSVVGATLTLASITIVANTIRLTLFNRKHDIGILRMLGATEAFIKGPFLIEGVALGTLGAGLSLILLKIIFELVIYRIGEAFIQKHTIIFLSPTALVGVIVCGASLGFAGAMLSLKQTRKA
tara:strand:- start:9937 stop:10830 length:894 start_codon:yes stop_codon:yes gene_type:complete